MPNRHAQTFSLTPHPAARVQGVSRLVCQLARIPGGLAVSYRLEGELERLRVPDVREMPRFADELWRHTCFEMFITRKGTPDYLELNFSPSGEWAAYAFARYRERVPLDTVVDLAAIHPRVAAHRSTGTLVVGAAVPLDRLAPRYANANLVLGLSAVIEAHDGSLSYWALRHPSAKPDFHHPDAFVLELDEIRN